MGQIVWARLMETQIWHCLLALLGVGSETEHWPLPELLSGRKLLSSSCLMLDNSFPPRMSLIPFNLWLWHWSSEWVSPSKSVHGPVKRKCLGFQQFLSSTASISSGFYIQKLAGFIFLALEPWAGGPGVGLELLTSEISRPNFYPPQVDVGPAHSASPPLLLVLIWSFFNSSCRTSIQLNFWWFWMINVL